MPAFLSDAWFARAWQLLESVEPAGVKLSGRVQMTCTDPEGERRWGYTVEAGRLAAMAQGELADADVEVLQTRDDARQICFGEIDGSEALRRTRISAGGHTGSSPPNDLGESPAVDALPKLPGATMVVQYEYANGPFGHVSQWIEFVDGRVGGMDFGRRKAAEVTVSIPYFAMALLRSRDISVLEAVELGGVTGEIGPLGALLGITESPEWRRVQDATGRNAVPLAALGEVAAQPSFRAAWETLVEETDR